MKWDLKTREHKNLFFNDLLKSRNKPSNDIKSTIKKQTQNKKTWTSNLQEKKKKKNEHHQIKEHKQKQTQENEDWHKPEKNIEIQL